MYKYLSLKFEGTTSFVIKREVQEAQTESSTGTLGIQSYTGFKYHITGSKLPALNNFSCCQRKPFAVLRILIIFSPRLSHV